MKDSFELIQHNFPDADEITIIPVYDLHLKSLLCNEVAWKKFCAWLPAQKNTYLILGGDMINNNLRSSVGSPYEDLMRPRDQKAALKEYLQPIKHLILCALLGNHEARSEKDADDDPMYDVMSKLDIEDLYRQDGAFLKIGVGTADKGNGRTGAENTYLIYVTHGAGGGILTGATVNRNERFSYVIEGLDGMIVGHSHKGAITKPGRIVVDLRANTISRRKTVVISSESWQSFGGYAQRKMMLPSSEVDPDNPQMLMLSGVRDKRNIKVVW
ncbi:MAG: hypothetical protein EOM14_13760 [Clostridia bacterium]|nr:hypothetical protein [Clostridia bacterium]